MTQASCLFCRIVVGEIPSARVYEDPEIIAINDIHPQAPVHVLVLPREHIVELAAAADGHRDLLGRLLLAVKRVAEQTGIAGSGYRVIANSGPDSGQEVPHLHIHVIPRFDGDGGGSLQSVIRVPSSKSIQAIAKRIREGK